MKENLNSKNEYSQIKINSDDDIDLKLILKTLLRNKSLIGLISFVTIILGFSYSFAVKEVWEGQFQIVINKENSSANINPQLANLAGINLTKGKNELQTEVEVLKSPSVLMPVFEFSKSKESQKNNLRFF